MSKQFEWDLEAARHWGLIATRARVNDPSGVPFLSQVSLPDILTVHFFDDEQGEIAWSEVRDERVIEAICNRGLRGLLEAS